MRHQHSPHLTGIRAKPEMHLAPHATLRISTLAHLQFALTVDPHAGAVDHQMDRLTVADDGQMDLKRLRTAAERRVVGHGRGGDNQLSQALREALQRAQPQAEQGLEAQRCFDHRVAVQTRTAAGRLGVGYARKRDFSDPHRDVTSAVGQPVPDTVARLRCTRLAAVPTHLLEVKNRESPQEPELLAGGRIGCVAQTSGGRLLARYM